MKRLIADIDAGLKETSSNLMYLNILRDSCKNIKVTEDVENSMTDAVLLILFIWSDSPFYSATYGTINKLRNTKSARSHLKVYFFFLEVT